MSQFQMPINIYQAMEYINNNYYLLPAFQREFVWKSEQIEKLFDSLMRGYPTSSMLFWKVEGNTKTKWKFYKFISSYVRDAKDYSITNELFNTSSANDFFAVLDGQQRLTAMRIGIYGSYSYHEPRKSWTYSNSSFPSRHMYLCLSKTGSNNDDCQYFFSFLKDADTNNTTFWTDNNNQIWFKVGAVIDYHLSGEEISDYFEEIGLNKDQRKIIKRLENTIFTNPSITFYQEDEQNPEKAVRIFTRINSGGTYLSFSDIVFSLMVSNWETKDAKTEINELIKAVGQKGFDIRKDYIVKVFLYLYHSSVKTEINSFTKEFCKILEDNWDEINSAILSLFDLLRGFGLTSFNLTSNNATLPVLYYLYHKNIYEDFTNKVGYKEERLAIKNWIFSSILRKTFGGQSDSTLQQTRKYFTEDITKSFIDSDIVFDGDAINKNIKNLTPVDDSFFEGLFSVQKDNLYAFPILSLLYPHLDYKNNDFHKDHIHAENLYQFLPEDLKQKYPFKVYNSILNLQMLDKNENESKGQKTLEEWVSLQCPQTDSRERFLSSHLIPNVNLSLSNFEEFIEKRKEMIKKKLFEILV